MSRSTGRLSVLVLFVLIFLMLANTMAWANCNSPVLEDQCTFKGYRFDIAGVPDEVDIAATCKKVSSNFYIFVEDSVWDSNKVTQSKVDSILDALESSTPSPDFPDGIYTEIKDMFISVPDYDEDGHIWIVIHDILHTESADTNVSSYFREIDLQYKFDSPVEGSNGHEIIFLDSSQVDGTERLSDLTYQLVDMIHYSRKNDEEKWVRDVVARQFPIIFGYTDYLSKITTFSKNSFQSLQGDVVSEDFTRIYHGATALFGLFIEDLYGPYFFELWSGSSTTGQSGFNGVMSIYEPGITFCDILHRWVIANGVNRGDYSYSSYDLPPFSYVVISQFPNTSVAKLDGFASSYFAVRTDSINEEDKLKLTMQFPEVADVRLSIAKYNTNNTDAFEITNETIMADEDTVVEFDDFYGVYNRILVILSRCNDSESMQYQIKAELISPQIDGDTDTAEDGDTTIDGDDDVDGDTTEDGDSDSESMEAGEDVIYGTKTCTEINNCQNRCTTKSCIEDCISEGTSSAQKDWNNFYTCMTGDYDGGLNCLELPDLDMRNTCIKGQCPQELYEDCKLTSGSVITTDDVGGSNCNNIGHKHYSALFILLLTVTLLVIRRGRTIV